MRGAAEQPPATMIPLGILGVDKSMARKRDVAKAKQLLDRCGPSERLRGQAQLLDAPAPRRAD